MLKQEMPEHNTPVHSLAKIYEAKEAVPLCTGINTNISALLVLLTKVSLLIMQTTFSAELSVHTQEMPKNNIPVQTSMTIGEASNVHVCGGRSCL